ncbi:MAG: hypothetical protein ABSC94_23050 [Polyangiaceae bacterium]
MTGSARRGFDAQDLTIAIGVALLAQFGFVAAFSMPTPTLVEADISNDNAQPIAVAITPVLKIGTKTPSKLPSPWQRKKPVAAKSESHAALPSSQADKTPEAIPSTNVPDAAVAPHAADAGKPEQPNLTSPEDAGSVATAASLGVEQGATNGTETDPLKARAADIYRAQLLAWFSAHFRIRGKIPFDRLKTLHSGTMVSISSDRKVEGFSVVRPSGDPTFDAEVQNTLSEIQSSGIELPAPPPMYPEILKSTLSVRFECTVQKNCE